MWRHGMIVAVAVVAALGVGCAKQDGAQDGHGHGGKPLQKHENMWESVNYAVAVVHPTAGNNVQGTVKFWELQDGRTRIVADITGLQPNSAHGFHLHEYGDCTDPKAESAGGHYNPQGHPHGGPQQQPRHAGDFGNLQADANGRARLELVVDNLTIAGLKNPAIGRAVIVHAKPDDLQSQPTGDAGARLGCGVVGVGNPKFQ